jgi:hypothetical protein
VGPITGGPDEDSGAETASHYRFQYCCAAARLLAAIAEGRACEVICEWHEDFLVVQQDGSLEAVSVKHRGQSRPQWSVATLVADGGLSRLFGTFQAADGQLQCCFESNRSHVAEALWSKNPVEREKTREDLAARLGARIDEIDPFVDSLQLERTVPSRDYIEAAYSSMLAAPALDHLGLELDESKAVRVAVDLVAEASREQISADALRAVLVAPASEREAVIAEHALADRRVNDEDLAQALREATLVQVPRLPNGVPDSEPPPETTMTKKLERGGLGPSVIRTAGRRRAQWYGHRARHRDISEREEELNSLEEWVQDQANLAETETRRSDNESYGGEMYSRLTAVLRDPEAPPAGIRQEDRDPALLSGAAFELTDACSIWWSPEFVVEDDADA